MAFIGARGAGIGLDVKADLSQVRRMLSDLERRVVPTAASQALNRTIRSVRSTVVKDLYQQTGVKQKLIRAKLHMRSASRKDLRAVLDASDAKAVNLIEYVDPGQRKIGFFNKRLKSGKYKAAGVKARAWGKRKVYKGTFIGTSGKGKLTVYARVGSARDRLKLISGPSIRRTFVREAIQDAMRKHARTRWDIEFERALSNQLARMRARGQ